MIHELKIDPKEYMDVLAGVKTFDVRKEDRLYEVGHTLYFREFDGKIYTGRILFKKVVYVYRDFALKKDYCILGLS